MSNIPDLCSRDTFAKLIGVSAPTLNNYIKKGIIDDDDYYMRGKTLFFVKDSAKKYLGISTRKKGTLGYGRKSALVLYIAFDINDKPNNEVIDKIMSEKGYVEFGVSESIDVENLSNRYTIEVVYKDDLDSFRNPLKSIISHHYNEVYLFNNEMITDRLWGSFLDAVVDSGVCEKVEQL